MRKSVTLTSQGLVNIMGSDWDALSEDRDTDIYYLTIQNLGSNPIYLENGENATVLNGYKLSSGNEVEIPMKRIQNLNLIAETSINDNIRFITT